jgi:hypothetical protein
MYILNLVRKFAPGFLAHLIHRKFGPHHAYAAGRVIDITYTLLAGNSYINSSGYVRGNEI